MLANIAPMARRAAAMTAVVASVLLVLSGVFGGHKALAGAAIAVGVVTGFCGLSVLVLGRAAKISPQAMALAGIATYFVKILLLLFLVGQLQNSTAFSAFVFGLSTIVLVLVYDAGLIVSWMRTKMLYVEPDGER